MSMTGLEIRDVCIGHMTMPDNHDNGALVHNATVT